MGKYFGTDGFRGEANIGLNAEQAFKIGKFLGWYYKKLKEKNNKKDKVRIVIGKDTRRSSYMFEYALSAGITSTGADAYLLHVTTTPSVSYVTRCDKFDCGIMISASHNPYYDNGIKLINSFGEKMDDEVISYIEDYLDGKLKVFGKDINDVEYAMKDNIGCTVDYVAGRNRYVGYLISLGIYSFKGIKVGLDCANGSSWMIAKNVFESLGATTYIINAEPNGLNINKECGSTHIEFLQKYVKDNNLDVGFAFDGDADRCICVDENGEVLDGDSILYISGKYLKDQARLKSNTIVTTVMSNYGLYKSLDKLGINYVQTQVGDKYVYEYMSEHKNELGGEQSGHVIFSKYATTGDGIVTSLMMMEAMISSKMKMSDLKKELMVYPQVLKNIKVIDKEKVVKDKELLKKVEEINKELTGNGRILFRASGTEPVIRIMVEASNEDICNKYIDDVTMLMKEKKYI